MQLNQAKKSNTVQGTSCCFQNIVFFPEIVKQKTKQNKNNKKTQLNNKKCNIPGRHKQVVDKSQISGNLLMNCLNSTYNSNISKESVNGSQGKYDTKFPSSYK